MCKFLFMADLHVKLRTWQNFPGLYGDSYEGLHKVIELGAEGKLASSGLPDTLVIGGDLFDSNKPTSFDVLEVYRFLRKFRNVLYISGNHDNARPSWLEGLSPYYQPLSSLGGGEFVVALDDAIIAGVPWSPDPDDVKYHIRNALSSVVQHDRYAGASNVFLVLHSSFKHLLGFDGSYQLDIAFINSLAIDKPITVLVGDIHKFSTRCIDAGKIHSPGSLYPCNWGEIDEHHGVSIVDTTTGEIEHVEISVRQYHDIRLTGTRADAQDICRKLVDDSGSYAECTLAPCARVHMDKWSAEDKFPFSVPGLVIQFVDGDAEPEIVPESSDCADDMSIEQSVTEELGDDVERELAIDLVTSQDPRGRLHEWLTDRKVQLN